MFNWAKQQLANVAGTQEPIYGPEAIQSVNEQQTEHGFTELTKNDLRWAAMESTCVETQTFYLTADNGYVGWVQIIYNNIAGLRTTCQFNTKIYYPDGTTPNLWSSDPLSNIDFDDDKFSFFADGCSMELSEDGSFYTIKSATNEASLVNLKIIRTAPGFMAGKNGTTTYGTDPKEPWGSMRHAFWPRCHVEGSIITKAGEVDFLGKGFFSFALQGMKPHHAACRWNFANFQGPTYSAVMMEFITPPSYGDTVVRVGGIVKDGKILTAGNMGICTHTAVAQDSENDWPEPTAAKYHWEGKTAEGQAVVADIDGTLGKRLDRVDVMAEVPGFVKNIVAAAAGTRPYIYQYAPKLELTLKIGDEVIQEKGACYTEATFIS